jgi:glutamine phosphoribosylpyrophosphate amidotransferase
MCGIIGGIYNNNITPILVDGLKRLEYRGYDSAGLVVLNADNQLKRMRAVGKVINLENNIKNMPSTLDGTLGIAHTRWATHGKPSSQNAHPHICNNTVGVVHNGIIENFLALKTEQIKQGYNVAMVFNKNRTEDLPKMYQGLKVVDGDKTDLRTLKNDGKNVIVGLRAKMSKKNMNHELTKKRGLKFLVNSNSLEHLKRDVKNMEVK